MEQVCGFIGWYTRETVRENRVPEVDTAALE
jgi:hypothetical protein